MMKQLVPAFLTTALLGFGVATTTACPPTGEGEGEGEGQAAGEGEGQAAGEGEGQAGEGEGEGEGEGGGQTIFDRIGGDAGVKALIEDFVLNQVVPDPNINGYFSNDTLDANRLITCLAAQVSAATGKPGATYPSGQGQTQDFPNIEGAGNVTCRDMATIHATLGISKADFDDLINDFVAAMTAKGVAAADQQAIGTVLGGLQDQIVDPNELTNDGSIYQRLGRKPGILTALNGTDCDPNTAGNQDCFVATVLADAAINGFFNNDTSLDPTRLVTCLERQVSQATGGPEVYDHANAVVDGTALSASGSLVQCRDMLSVHQNLTANGQAGGAKITKAEFDDLETDLVNVLTSLGVAGADITAIATALNTDTNVAGIDANGLCKDVVQVDPQNCQ